MRGDSVDLFSTQGRGDPSEVIGRVKLVDGKVVAEGGSWVEELIRRPHGDTAFRDRLVSADEGAEFLVAVVEQYHGSGLRAAWTPKEPSSEVTR